jgi:geranylgeranyl diphosphate synthase type II
MEMLHNAFLIHDDIEDASVRRRGGPTLHELHGVGLAINAGDALAALALQPLQRDDLLSARLSRRLVTEFALAVRLTTEGQALELGWRSNNVVDLGPADYLGLAGRKTSWYTTVAPLRMGALVGSRGAASLPALSRFGFYLGAAFQIQDDLLSTADRDAVHGKDPLGDIREGKRTLMLVHLLAEATGTHRSFLVDYLATPQADRTPAAGRRVLALMKRYGSLEFARQYGSGIIAAACDAFAPAFAEAPPSEHLEFIRGLIPYLLARSA